MKWLYDLVSKSGCAPEWKWTPFIMIRAQQTWHRLSGNQGVWSPPAEKLSPWAAGLEALESVPSSSVCNRHKEFMILVNDPPGLRWCHPVLQLDSPGPKAKTVSVHQLPPRMPLPLAGAQPLEIIIPHCLESCLNDRRLINVENRISLNISWNPIIVRRVKSYIITAVKICFSYLRNLALILHLT